GAPPGVDHVPATTAEQHVVPAAPGDDVVAAVCGVEADRLDRADRELVDREHGGRVVELLGGRDPGVVAQHDVAAVAADDHVVAGAAENDVVAVAGGDDVGAAHGSR